MYSSLKYAALHVRQASRHVETLAMAFSGLVSVLVGRVANPKPLTAEYDRFRVSKGRETRGETVELRVMLLLFSLTMPIHKETDEMLSHITF